MNSRYNQGIKFAFFTAFFSGFANFLNKFTLDIVGDPLIHTTIKNLLVSFMIISGLIVTKKFTRIKQLSKRNLISLFAIGVVGGSIPFYLFFLGLSQMPAINAAIIHKTLIFWVAMLAFPILNEKISAKQIGALGLIFSANLLTGGFRGFAFSKPELMVLFATMLWAIENIIAKITLKRVDPDIVVGARMGIGSFILLTVVIFSGKTQAMSSLDINQMGLLALTSFILFAYVITWYRALKLAPVTMVATVLTLATLVTNLLSAIFVTRSISFEQFAQFIFIAAGTWFFLRATYKLSNSTAEQHETFVSI